MTTGVSRVRPLDTYFFLTRSNNSSDTSRRKIAETIAVISRRVMNGTAIFHAASHESPGDALLLDRAAIGLSFD